MLSHRPGPMVARRRLAGALLLTAAVVTVSASSGSARNVLRLTPCEIQGVSARCGTFTVPENRARPNGRTIGLNLVVVPAARKPALPDAFTYLTGGPGGAATQATSWVIETFALVHARHDLLLVDQRGTGTSKPLLCALPAKDLTTVAQKRTYARGCLQSLHVDVRQFGTRTAMDDLDAVRAALGYRQLDVYGASYGATAAQVYLKRHPASVRTMVLDGATAIDVPFFGRFAANAQAALDDLANRCAASPTCDDAFPDWRASFSRLVREWDAKPAHTGKHETTSGSGLASVVQSMLTNASTAAEIPLLVSRAAGGDYVPLNRNISRGPQSLNVMFYSIWCSEPWVGLGARGPWHTDFDSDTESALRFHRGVCAYLPKRAEPASAWTEPRSTAPLLLLAGGADPQDPVSNMPQLAQTFPRSRTIVVPGLGHTVAQYGCLGTVIARFVIAGNPRTVDARCVGAIRPPAFVLR